MKSVKSKKPYIWVERPKVISALRRIFRTYPNYKAVLTSCKSEYFVPCKNGRKKRRVHFRCEMCHDTVDRKKFSIDHREPVLDPIQGFVDYNTYVARLFCPIDNLQGLCKACHDFKSKQENAQRRKTKKEKLK